MLPKCLRLLAVYKSLDELTRFLQPALLFVNSHNVDYFTTDLWNKNLPDKLRQDLESLPVTVELLQSHIDKLVDGTWEDEVCENANDVCFVDCTMNELVYRVGQLLLPNMNMSTPVNQLPFLEKKGQSALGLNLTENELKFDTFMSLKKMHEVEIMADFINKIGNVPPRYDTSEAAIQYFVDLGSGKGYLSSFLTLLYEYNVLAIDASSVNTKGSSERANRLQKVWASLIRRAMERRCSESGLSSRRGKHWKSKQGNPTQPNQSENILIEEETEAKPIATKSENTVRLRNLTSFVTQDANLDKVLAKSFDLAPDAESPDFGIVGLHTCGSLGVDSLRLFVANDKAKFVVNVPCCYHLLEETLFQPHSPENEFLFYKPMGSEDKQRTTTQNFWGAENEALAPKPSFPLSEHLRKQQFNLGRNARMLSSYSLERLSQDMKKSTELDQPLLWRLLFQVVLKEKLGHTLMERNVGKLGSSCSSFREYVRRALVKVHLETVEISDDEIDAIYQRHEPQFQKYHCFFLIRALFAPLVEACILLDRMAYLLEQKCVDQAYIVQLFDPFLSPRCNAIFATKKNY